ncbi:MAG: flagellar protein export ATPase FliI [Clostridiales bacterium]|mgnify:CR=1 FL=1|nr:flagellar protein export ATPase FliI [Clostridiales bacterium]
MKAIDFDIYRNTLNNIQGISYTGQVTQVIGLTIESLGPSVQIGEVCLLNNYNRTRTIKAEVVGFKNDRVLLMPLGDVQGIGPGSLVESTHSSLKVSVGEGLVGRILDGLGNPMDGKGPILDPKWVPIDNSPPSPLDRQRITQPLTLGIKAVDGLLTCGKGQRLGVFAGSGVGKSTLLGMIARNTEADINVIALIGERGREVKDFIEKDLTEEGLKRSVLVVATSDQPALVRVKAPLVATAIAEYFREQGLDTLLMMDSLTRFAMAQREIGLAIGEPPVARGYTPSVLAELPRLVERAGNSAQGTITALYTVLVDGDDFNEPISDAVRGLLDGHVVLSRDLANSNHYPAIDILASVSRVMPDLIDNDHLQRAGRIKSLMATYRESQDLINIGAYNAGSNPLIDEAIEKIPMINKFLQQLVGENYDMDRTLKLMAEIV